MTKNADFFPYIKAFPIDGRKIIQISWWNFLESRWELWFDIDGTMAPMSGGRPVAGPYLSKIPVNEKTDYHFSLATLVFNNLSFENMISPISKLIHITMRFSAILEQYEVLEKHAKDQDRGTSSPALVVSLLEHLVSLARTYMDLLQKLVGQYLYLSRNGESGERVYNKKQVNLKIMEISQKKNSKELRNEDEIVAEFGLPLPLAKFYSSHSDVFQWINDLRNRIEHDGDQPGHIFFLDDGFGVLKDDAFWGDNFKWDADDIKEERFASLRGIFHAIVRFSLDSANRLGFVLASYTDVPDSIYDDNKIFIRDYYSSHLNSLYEKDLNPWNSLSYVPPNENEKTMGNLIIEQTDNK